MSTLTKKLAVPALSLFLGFAGAACRNSDPVVSKGSDAPPIHPLSHGNTTSKAPNPINVGDEIPVPADASTWIHTDKDIHFIFTGYADLDSNPETKDQYFEQPGVLARPDACIPRGGRYMVLSASHTENSSSVLYLYDSPEFREFKGEFNSVSKSKGGDNLCPHGVPTSSLSLSDLYKLRDGSAPAP